MLDSFSGATTTLFGPEPPVGTRLGNYVLEQKLGQGGMGQVWRAKHETTGKQYALKLLPAIIAKHDDAWDQVHKNFRLVSELIHQSICPLYILERDPHWGPFLVMNYIDGVTLTKYRAGQETFSVAEVAALLRPVAEALDFGHAQKIVHRDIKHGNILLTTAARSKQVASVFVIDFGLAAQIRTTIGRFSEHQAPTAGTRPFMAPELWRGRPATPQSDQYALAVVAYELLAGYLPFESDEVMVLRECVLNDDVEPVAGLAAHTNQVLSKALAKDPQMRFPNCGAFVAALSRPETLAAPVPIQPSIVVPLVSPAQVKPPADSFAGATAGEIKTLKHEKIDVSFCWCPPGKFTMGSPIYEKHRRSDENQVGVELTQGFWMGQTVVTQELYTSVIAGNPSKFQAKGAKRPVEQVSWEEANQFCLFLTAWMKDHQVLPAGWKITLPTEAQWEYACRAGTKTMYSFGGEESDLPQHGWFAGNAGNETHDVKMKQPNAWKLYDMHGNVWEWCSDLYGDKLFGGSNPVGPSTGSGRVFRGGSWLNAASLCRSTDRNWNSPDYRINDLGFRMVAVPSSK